MMPRRDNGEPRSRATKGKPMTTPEKLAALRTLMKKQKLDARHEANVGTPIVLSSTRPFRIRTGCRASGNRGGPAATEPSA